MPLIAFGESAEDGCNNEDGCGSKKDDPSSNSDSEWHPDQVADAHEKGRVGHQSSDICVVLAHGDILGYVETE